MALNTMRNICGKARRGLNRDELAGYLYRGSYPRLISIGLSGRNELARYLYRGSYPRLISAGLSGRNEVAGPSYRGSYPRLISFGLSGRKKVARARTKIICPNIEMVRTAAKII